MPATIGQDILNKLTTKAYQQPEIVEFKAHSLPEDLKAQINRDDCLLFSFIVKISTGENVKVNFVVPESIYNDETKHIFATSGLVYVSGTVIVNKDSYVSPYEGFAVTSFGNRGEATFFVTPDEQKLVPLVNAVPEEIANRTEQLNNLVALLQSVPKVTEVRLEEVLDESLLSDVDNSIMFACKVNITINKQFGREQTNEDEAPVIKSMPFNFILPENVYNDEEQHDNIMKNLNDWITKIDDEI
jgi:hypothetical protein